VLVGNGGAAIPIDQPRDAKRIPRAAVWAALGFVALALAWYAFGTGSSNTKQSQKNAPREIAVITSKAELRDYHIRRRTIGTIESPAVVVIRSRIDSQVLQQNVTDGQLVRKGDVLFVLDDREIQAQIARDQAQLAKNMATLAQAKAELDRKQILIEKNIASVQQLDEATAAFKAAQQTVEADQAVLQADRLRLGYARIEAPITGRIGAIRVTPGNLVSANDAAGLVTITQIRPIRAAFTLSERDLPALRKAFNSKPPAEVRVYSPGESESLQSGTLDFVDSSVDITSGTISAKGRFTNQNFELWPGLFVDIEVDLSVRPNTVMIPAVAIQSGQKGPFVFVARDDQTAEMRAIELLGIDGNLAAIASGVKEGERVVVEGQMRLTTGARIAETSAPQPVAPPKPTPTPAPTPKAEPAQ
jgi:multidrug efflux system membrane fusion protein